MTTTTHTGCPLCDEGHHPTSMSNPDLCTCCGLDMSHIPRVEFSTPPERKE